MKSSCHSLVIFLRAESVFNLLYALVFLCMVIISAVTEKAELHLMINQHVGIADGFFSLITVLGDGLTASLFVILLLFLNINTAIRSLYAFLLSTLIVWICKFLIFTDTCRPKVVFEQLNTAIHLVPGVEVYGYNSFPSGHATSVFAIFTCIAYMNRNQVVKAVLLFIAILTAFSRVYLSQHFLEDVMIGSLIGFLSAMLVFYWLRTTSFAWNKKKLISVLRTS